MEQKQPFKAASVLCVGTELLLGDIVNTNFAHIARELAALGVPLYHEACVGDNPTRLRRALEYALSTSDLVITTGGLGPTKDDLTKETVAEALGLPLERDALAEANVRERFHAMHKGEVGENNLKQADLPRGSAVFYNSVGTAPGFAAEVGGKCVCSLPGVPHEMKTMFAQYVIPMIKDRNSLHIFSRNLHVCGVGESAVDAMLGDLTEGANPTLAPYCKAGETRLRLSARAATEAEGKAMLDALENAVRRTEAGKYVYFVTHTNEDADRAAPLAAVSRLRELGMTVAFAESVTGGLCAKMITDVPGASAVLRGSAVVYATETKTSVLGVDPDIIDRYGVVSEECAAAMAVGAKRLYGSAAAISTTGLADASPYADRRGVAVGTVCIGIARGDDVRAITLTYGSGHTRAYIRELAATRVMHILATL